MLQARYPVVLASASPRRRDLLSRLFAEFEVVVPIVNEELLRTDDPWRTADSSAIEKALRISEDRPEALVIAGDTVVAIEDPGESRWRQLGKPSNASDAAGMLRSLSDRRHAVISAVALRSPDVSTNFNETSWVTFRALDQSEIEDYVASGEPMDKAGAYAIQGGAKGFVTIVEGQLSTVIGLPIERLELELISCGLAATCSKATT